MTSSKVKRSSTNSPRKSTNTGVKASDREPKFDRNNKHIPSTKLRLLLVWLVLFLGALGLTCRLFTLQIIRSVNGKDLRAQTEIRQWTKLTPYNPRRQIVDRYSNIIATDELIYSLYAHPKMFKFSKPEIAKQLADVIPNSDLEQIEKKLEKGNSGILIANNLPESVADRINQLRDQKTGLKLDGLDLEKKYARFYPYQDMVAEIVGYLDRERDPQAGVELTQDRLLQRPISTYHVKRSFMNSQQVFQPGDLPEKLLKSDDLRLQLTLDMRLQQAARNALQEKMKQYKAKRGAVIVMDAKDGSILSMVCEPTYNPNFYYKYNIDLFRNWAVSDLYEPGSTFKPINVAIALDANLISPNSIFFDQGKITIDGSEIKNHDYDKEGARGALNIAQILQHSSNVGMIKIMSRLQRKDYYRDLLKLGIHKKTPFDLPGSTPGHLKSEVEFTVRQIESATAAFGQGFSLTPLKLVQLHGAIANGGKLVIPHIVLGLSDYQGYAHWKPSYPEQRVFSEPTTRSVLQMMESVVEKGSGQLSKIPGYRIAGKTGTAQKVGLVGKGYAKNAKITSFVSIFPVESPRYVILAVVDEPKGEFTFGSTVAAPIVKSVINSLIQIESIPPSRSIESQSSPTNQGNPTVKEKNSFPNHRSTEINGDWLQ